MRSLVSKHMKLLHHLQNYKPNSGEVFIIFITTWSTKNRVCDKTLKQMAYQRHGTNSIDEGDDFFFSCTADYRLNKLIKDEVSFR